ncbi:MAG: hypothetical protein ACJ79D_05760 [Myxococcales bacterium]
MVHRGLAAGDVVEVRSAGEILATLDDSGALEALPFMPEMLPYIGRRFVVDKRADKICDTIAQTGSRRLNDAVLLGDLRCDGRAHAGCQAECRLFWKERWLRPVESLRPVSAAASEDPSYQTLRWLADANRQRGDRYRCQATELLRASERLRTFDPRPYVREYTSGNVPLGTFVKVFARAAVEQPLLKLKLLGGPPLHGDTAASPRHPTLGLQPGDWVQVKSAEEIETTLNRDGKHRGLYFDREMLPFCGKTYRVKKRIERIIDDHTGAIIEMKSDCVTLENVVCSGEHSFSRYFCPRAILPYWRECWLKRVAAPSVEERVEAC